MKTKLRDDCIKIYFEFPIDGDCFTDGDGRIDGDFLYTEIRVAASVGADITVCGERAMLSDGLYGCTLPLKAGRNTLTACDSVSGESAEIDVYFLPNAGRKFMVSVDDNILFLANLTKNKDTYRSIFEDPYLAVYKEAHDKYGMPVQLNLFYEFKPEESLFSSPERKYFSLSMMTDKFREEFRENADWLKLAFHARSEMPDEPYKNATSEQLAHDYWLIVSEIERFAGKECISDSVTVHWGEANIEGVKALRAFGVSSLMGYFEKTSSGKPLVAYYTDGELCDHIGGRDFWYDKETDMFFGQIDVVMNLKTYDWVREKLARSLSSSGTRGFAELMIHEQYFYEDYKYCRTDFRKRVLDSCKYVYDMGYRGSHITDAIK